MGIDVGGTWVGHKARAPLAGASADGGAVKPAGRLSGTGGQRSIRPERRANRGGAWGGLEPGRLCCPLAEAWQGPGSAFKGEIGVIGVRILHSATSRARAGCQAAVAPRCSSL